MAIPRVIVVVGAGQSGYWTVKTLRNEGYDGKLVLIGAEAFPPYDRPPLSKKVLTGEAEPRSIWYLSAEDFANLRIEFLPATRVLSIDPHERKVVTQSAGALTYDHLVLTTGARPRRLDLAGEQTAPVHYLRDLEDCLRLREVLEPGRRIVVIGGGLIGLEVAAAAVARGCQAVIVEAAERIVARVLGPEVSAFLTALHRRHGVEILNSKRPVRFENGANACRVICEDGSMPEGDAIVIGIGVVPNDSLAAEAGLKVGNGIWVDEYCHSTDPHISAAGDVTNHFNPRLGRRFRLESWQNAQNQAIAAAQAICGEYKPYCEIPWGWTDQFGVNIQMLGLPTSFANGLLRGDPKDDAFSLFYLDGRCMTAMAAIGTARDVAISRRLIERGITLDASRLVDRDIAMKALLKG
jgi:3-phenylpropionate/trans-cinnamate dioxygenase ferredoxin reductase subunit